MLRHMNQDDQALQFTSVRGRQTHRPAGSACTFAICATFILSLAFPVARGWAAEGESPPVGVQTLKSHSRLTFRVDEGVETQWRDTAGGFEVLFKGVQRLADLGLDSGLSAPEMADLIQHSHDARLARLSYKETTQGLVLVGRWSFGKEGSKDLETGRMEHFEYRLKQPAAYVVDFWSNVGTSRSELKAKTERDSRADLIKKLEDEARARKARQLEAERQTREADDIARFCTQPLAESKDIFLGFQPVHEPLDLTRWFSPTTPDSRYNYLEPSQPTPDAKFVRLALDLYRQGKPALAIKTLDMMDQEYPRSDFRAEMRFLRANALIRLGMEEPALGILQELVAVGGDTGVVLQAATFLALKHFQKGETLNSLESFLWLINRYPAHQLAWVFHLGAAESLYSLRQTERALKEYQWVATNAPDRAAQSEGAFRMGDLYLVRREYESALASYYQAATHYEAEAKNFASLNINRAESLYWLGQYKRADEAFAAFLTKFPTHPAGWRASYRQGEIAGRQPGEASIARSRALFYDTINHYPLSPGATLARARLLPCGDHGGMDVAAMDRYFGTDTAQFDGAGEVFMDRYRDYRGLAQVRALMSLGLLERSVDVAIHELAANPKSEARQIVGEALRTVFRKSVLSLLDQGKKYEALVFYQEKAESLPKVTRLQDADYLLKLSQAASDLELGGFAQKLAAAYRAVPDAPARMIAGEGQGKGDIETALRLSERNFTEAKALWSAQGVQAEGKIRELLSDVKEESTFSDEREVLLGLLDAKLGHPASALGHAVKAQLLAPGPAVFDSEASARLDFWIASLNSEAGDPRSALEIYKRLESRAPENWIPRAPASADAGVARASKRASDVYASLSPVPGLEYLLLRQAELLEKLSRWDEAADAYGRAVKKGMGGNRALYGYAHALGRSPASDSRAKGQTALKKLLESKQDDFWKKLAGQEAGTGK